MRGNPSAILKHDYGNYKYVGVAVDCAGVDKRRKLENSKVTKSLSISRHTDYRQRGAQRGWRSISAAHASQARGRLYLARKRRSQQPEK